MPPVTASHGTPNLDPQEGRSMSVNLSPVVRLVIYIVGSVGSLLAGYLFVKGIVGREEVGLWGGFVALAFGLAGLNTPTVAMRRRDDSGQSVLYVLLVVLVVLVILALVGVL